ncbi:uncharacterized protein AMSG_04707 [Thecamonas trahens ATCC 50062]|uniref:VPS9 domain-containing protein n=1 Tax=Thecamonas trahens ATCC 50062 TaxID=461836 RepID=A0A0L0D9A5_THETB|nr:hypothetical protein AMSG_04707 [Thecamonas trahens ATCC 50062]KNC48962.1 hypothetical protein AMSG_04707 [Thecamonas trahens ATCC 50062]|eukprot:XP_013758379.1 hypothetical protein AMSG_04707 [Thecamonas trahens ATCC 50062]
MATTGDATAVAASSNETPATTGGREERHRSARSSRSEYEFLERELDAQRARARAAESLLACRTADEERVVSAGAEELLPATTESDGTGSMTAADMSTLRRKVAALKAESRRTERELREARQRATMWAAVRSGPALEEPEGEGRRMRALSTSVMFADERSGMDDDDNAMALAALVQGLDEAHAAGVRDDESDGLESASGPESEPDGVALPMMPSRLKLSEKLPMGQRLSRAEPEFREMFAACVAPWGDDRNAVLTTVYGSRGTVLRASDSAAASATSAEPRAVSSLKRVFFRRPNRTSPSVRLTKYADKLKAFLAKRAALVVDCNEREHEARKHLNREVSRWRDAAKARMVRRARHVFLQPIHVLRLLRELYQFQRRLGIAHLGVIHKVLARSDASMAALSIDEAETLAIPIPDLCGAHNYHVIRMRAFIERQEIQVKDLVRAYATEVKHVVMYTRADRLELIHGILAESPGASQLDGYFPEDELQQSLFNSLILDVAAPEGAAIRKFVNKTDAAGASLDPQAVVGFVDALANDLAVMYRVADADAARLHMLVARAVIPRDFGVSELFVAGAAAACLPLCADAIALAEDLPFHIVPSDVAANLVAFARAIYDQPTLDPDSSATLGADDTFPVVVYALVHSDLATPWAVLDFLNAFCSRPLFPSEAQYCAVTVEAALTHINQVSPADIDKHRTP